MKGDGGKLYTLEEAKRVLNAKECDKRGHHFEIRLWDDMPTRIECVRCGKSWLVGEEEAA